MRIKRPNSNRKLFLRIFMSLILCIVTTMLVLSTILYVNFEKVASNQIYLANSKSLDQVKEEVSIMANVALAVSNQIYQDVPVSKLLFYSEPDIFDVSPALRQLANYRLSTPFIDSIYVYNSNTSTIYTEAGKGGPIQSNLKDFTDIQIIDIIENCRDYKQYIPIPREYIDTDGLKKYYYTFIHYGLFTGNKLNNGAVITNISEDWIHNVINEGQEANGSDTFIIDSKGVLVSNGKRFAMMTDFSSLDYIKTIESNSTSSGYFVDKVNGKKSLIVYTKPDLFGWRYVRVLQWSTIFNGIENIRSITILIGLGILLVGILISFVVSGRIYLPIGKMILNLENLEIEKRSNSKALKQEFLRDLILGREISSRGILQESLKKLNISISIDSEICVLLFKIDNYKAFIHKYTIEDQNLYKFAIINIANEILSDSYKTEAVDMGQDAVLIIINISNLNSNSLQEDLTEASKKIQKAVTEYLNVSISITIGSIAKDIENIYELYNQVLEASLHRLIFGHGCIIPSDMIMQFKTKEYNYPIQKEKLLIDAIMAGKMNETRKIYNEIVEDTYTHSIIVYNLTISHLLFTLNNTINTIKTNNSIFDGLSFNIPIMLLNDAETVDGINSMFYELFEKIEKCLEEKKNSKYDTIIRRVNEIIKLKYADQSLSVDSIAEMIGISTPYICRIYKQNTLHTILDDVVKIRMEKAREFLLESDSAIEEIAEKVGFSNSSYFYKAFKAANGVTPSEYRKTRK